MKPVTNCVLPALLKQLWMEIKIVWAVGGFEGAGILPLNMEKPLARAADININQEDVAADVSLEVTP